MKQALCAIILFICAAALAFPADFGILASQQIEAGNGLFEYNPAFTPTSNA